MRNRRIKRKRLKKKKKGNYGINTQKKAQKKKIFTKKVQREKNINWGALNHKL